MAKHSSSKRDHVDLNSNIKPEVNIEKTKFPRRVIRDKIEFDNTYHPGVESADLSHTVHWIPVGGHNGYDGFDFCEAVRNPKQLCRNCGWTSLHELGCDGYTSRLKVMHLGDNSAIWELGPNGPWMLRDETNLATNSWKTDYVVQQFLRKEKINIPLIEMHRFGGPDDKFHFTIMSRAKGSPIDAIWDKLTPEQKTDVAHDLKNCIKKWRQITSPRMQKVDGSELRDAIIGNCTRYGCVKTGHTEEEWLQNLTPAMRKGFLFELWVKNRGKDADQFTRDSWIKQVDEKIAQLKANFPRGGPYVLTHNFLHGENIFISDDNEDKKFKVSAILDWKLAGFYPWWVEAIQAERLIFKVLGDDSDVLHPGYDARDWEKIWEAVSPVMEAWEKGGGITMSKHVPDQANRWYRSPFCACTPYCQEYRDNKLGQEEEHLDIFDVDTSDSDEEEAYQKFRKDDKEFLRWFKKISS